MNARTASAFSGLLARSPNSNTARREPLMIVAASSSERWLPAPNAGLAEPVSTALFDSPSITFFGRLTNAAPGRSDSAAANALAMISPTESGEPASAQNLVTGFSDDTAWNV